MTEPTIDDYRTAVRVLRELLRDEYPTGLTLAEIAGTWSGATGEEIAALRRVEAELGLVK